MKTLQKYANITLFLISATAMISTHANIGDDYFEFKERMIQQSNRPEMLKKAFKAGETIYLAVATTVLMSWATGLVMLYINTEAVRGRWIPIIKYEYLHKKWIAIKTSHLPTDGN
ncbi:MAG TPA: hypothetical protein VLB80_01590 [Candidatus Babeliales bacterium]|nr:hypothetical protein [Candidatus Babeliales bacterium]